MSKKATKPLVLVDGSSYLYRAFHGMPNLTNSRGEPTGAIYGVVNMLRSLLREYDPEHIAVIFDAKGKTFRDDMYSEYKANRAPMPNELRSQVEPIHDIVRAMGLPLMIIDGVEADDVIGTLCVQATAAGMKSLVSTGDKDMAQLVDDSVTLINTMTNVTSDPEGVIEKFGVRPDQIIDYLTLVGDKVDNVPGVPKCGPKTAVKWLDEHGDLETIMANADKVKGKVGEYLRDSLEQLPLSKQLVTIKCDVSLNETPESLQRKEPDTERLRELFAQYEFKTWLSEQIENGAGASTVEDTPTSIETDYEIVFSEDDFNKWLKLLKASEIFAFDTETTSLDYMQAEIVGVSFSVEAGKAAYVPVAHDYEDAPEQLSRDWVLKQLKPLLEDPKASKVGQNLKYDRNVLKNYDINLQGIKHDTMLQSYVLDSTASRHDMDSLSLKYLSHKTIKFEEVAGKGKAQLSFNQVNLEQAGPYAAEDADITLRLHEVLWPKLKTESALEKVYTEMEMPLLPVLSDIERQGVLIDADMLAEQSKQLAERIQEIQTEAWKEAGEEFNISSPKQIQVILFEKMELPVIKKTPKGQPSTAEAVLQELADDYALPKMILEYRSLSKLKSTYTDKLPLMINEKSGRVHTSYHQAVAATGRLSSSDPNLQNIPIRSEEGRRIRKAFIAPKGYTIVAADYSQIELRIMAHLSEDKGLLTAFSEGVDIHQATAAEVFGMDRDAVTTEQRRRAKAINFGLIYGMSAFGLAKQIDVSRTEAQQYIDLYFERYPGVKTFMETMREGARDVGYVETVFGRRLYVPDIKASNMQRRQYAERTAINAPMQGTAADIIKRAMLACAKFIGENNQQIKMIMQVHDELVFEIADTVLNEAIAGITKAMEGAAELKVPLEISVDTGINWDEAH